MATELVLLGTAGAPAPVAGRAGISSAVVVDGRVFVVDCGRGSPSAFAEAGLDFARLEAVFLTHLHADHVGDLPGMLLYPWGWRASRPPVQVYGPPRPEALPDGDAIFHRVTTIHPELPAPGTADLVGHILAGFAYHLNVMPLDARMPDAGMLVRGMDVAVPAGSAGPVVAFEDAAVRVRAVAVDHGRAVPALAYRFDTADGSVVFSGDTTVSENLVRLARAADILVHQVVDLDYLRQHGAGEPEMARMAASLTDVTQVGGVAERAGVRELILTHYLPADPRAITEEEWVRRAGPGFTGRITAGRDGLRRVLLRRAARLLEDDVLAAGEGQGAGAGEAGLLGDVEADGVPIRDGGAQPAVERHRPGVGDGGAAEFGAPALAGQVGPDADGDVQDGGLAGLPRRAGGLAQAAEAEQRVVLVGDGPVALVGRKRLEGVVDLPGTGLRFGGQGQAVLDGQLPHAEGRHGLVAAGRHRRTRDYWSKSRTTRSAAGWDWQASAYPAATSAGSRA